MHEESFFADPRTWVAISFIIFFALFGRKLWQVIAGMLDQRAIAVRAELSAAQRLREEAEAMLTQARASRDAALAEAKALLAGARTEAERAATQAAADAQAAAKRREQTAMDRIAAAEKAALDQVRIAAAEVAGEAAAKVLREHLGAAQDAPLIDRAIATLPGALAARRVA